MSRIVLLNKDGRIEHKTQLVSLPDDFEIPAGMRVSWRTTISAPPSGKDPVLWLERSRWLERMPQEAFFYLGDASAHLKASVTKEFELTVQGSSVSEVKRLHDRVTRLVQSGAGWKISNDLNSKPWIGIWGWLKLTARRVWLGDESSSAAA